MFKIKIADFIVNFYFQLTAALGFTFNWFNDYLPVF